MDLIQKYLLPKEIDFNTALKKQADASRRSVEDLADFCLGNDDKALQAILADEHHSRKLKNDNMQQLLNVFITPYDKESIYRMIVQLDWISLSVKHLAIDIKAYKVKCPKSYELIFTTLKDMIKALNNGFDDLSDKQLANILAKTEKIHDQYDEVTKQCALAAVAHLDHDDIRIYLVHKEILHRLKDVAKRIHLAANSLEDMAMKIV